MMITILFAIAAVLFLRFVSNGIGKCEKGGLR